MELDKHERELYFESDLSELPVYRYRTCIAYKFLALPSKKEFIQDNPHRSNTDEEIENKEKFVIRCYENSDLVV